MPLNSRTIVPLAPLAMLATLSVPGSAWAGTITAQGNVTVLTNVDELQGIVGSATYSEGGELVALDRYTPAGMTFHAEPLADILPGVMALGSGTQPTYEFGNNYFPAPIGGGGIATSYFSFSAGAVTFTQPVTQFGLTASRNGIQYITVWDTNGDLIGQVTWLPDDDAAFVGIDTNDVPIGLLTYGNDNVWAGATYDVGGTTIISDTWIWATGIPCQSDSECPADDDNPCTAAFDVCMLGNCVGDEIEPGCCTADDDCMPGEICMVDANSCIPDDDTTDTTDTTESDSTDTTSDGDSTSTESGDSTTTEGGSTTTTTTGFDDVGDDTTSDGADAPASPGCGCTTDEHGSGALFGLLGLALLGWLGSPRIIRPRED